MKKKKIIILLAFLLAVGFFIFSKIKNKNQVPVVEQTFKLEKKDLKSSIKTKGIVESVDKREISSDTEGKIEKLFVKKGDVVKKGDLLLQLKSDDLNYNLNNAQVRLDIEKENLQKLLRDDEDDLKNSIASQEIKLNDLKGEYERNQILFKEDAISEVTLNKSKDSYEQAKLDLELAKTKLEKSNRDTEISLQQKRIKLAELELNKYSKDISKYSITSPIDGTVVDINVGEGDLVYSKNILLTIQDMNNLEINIDMNEYDSSKLTLGAPVDITSESFKGNSFKGEVKYIDNIAKIKNNESIVEVKISINNIDDSIKPGFTAKAEVLIDEKKDVFSVPFQSVVTTKDGKKVIYALVNNEKVEIEVKTGISTDFEIEVISDKLEEGQDIILNPNASEMAI